MIVLLCSTSFPVVSSGLFELDPLECGLGLGSTGILDVILLVHPSTGITVRSVHWTCSCRENLSVRVSLWALVAFGSVLNKLNGFPISAIYYRGDGHGKGKYLKMRAVLNEMNCATGEIVGAEAIGTAQRKIVAAVTCPV